jgi:hypothetical protein
MGENKEENPTFQVCEGLKERRGRKKLHPNFDHILRHQ